MFDLTFTNPPLGSLTYEILHLFHLPITINKASLNVNHNTFRRRNTSLQGAQPTTKAAQDKNRARSHTSPGTILARWQWCSVAWDPLTRTVLQVSITAQSWASSTGARTSSAGLQPQDWAPVPVHTPQALDVSSLSHLSFSLSDLVNNVFLITTVHYY